MTSFVKIEVHAHLNGCVRMETLKELYAKHYPDEDIDLSLPDNLDECFHLFDAIHKVTLFKENVRRIAFEVVSDFAKDRVIYLELRTTVHETENFTMEEYIQEVYTGVREATRVNPSITVRLILSINRKSPEKIDSIVNLIQRSMMKYPDFIVGVDLAGNPSLNTFQEFVPALTALRNMGLSITLHFAELMNKEEQQAMIDFNPDRLGHAVRVSNDTTFSDTKTPVEVCLSSNVFTKSVESAETHPMKLEHKKRPLFFCTDDTLLFNNTPSTELELALTAFELDEKQVLEILFESVNHLFCKRPTMDHIRKQIIYHAFSRGVDAAFLDYFTVVVDSFDEANRIHQESIESGDETFFYFYSDWCPDCIASKEILNRVPPVQPMVMVNVGEKPYWKDQENEYRTEMNINCIPTLQLVSSFEVVASFGEQECQNEDLLMELLL
ncbi:hypothetical protein PCE1_004856 [Barthelona sp. PCE]